MADMLAGMACWKGSYYIQCCDEYEGIFIKPIEGYVICLLGDHYGFTRGVDGIYIITDCYTGGQINDIPREWRHNLMSSYRAPKKFASRNMAMIEKIRSSRLHRAIVLSVRDNAGFGATRLTRVFDPFVEDWRRLMARYLHKDREGLVAEMRRMLDRYNACPVFPSEYTL